MKSAKIYTKTGDKGTTSLADGSRLPKNSLRIEAYGTVDELNASIGIVKEYVRNSQNHDVQKMGQLCAALQNDLFNLGSDLATPMDKRWKNMLVVSEQSINKIEQCIDFYSEQIPPLREFVLPGGSLLNASLHVVRTVCRRAERLVVSLSEKEKINPFAVIYFNRLSDLLFVLSRFVVHCEGGAETRWEKEGGMSDFSLET